MQTKRPQLACWTIFHNQPCEIASQSGKALGLFRWAYNDALCTSHWFDIWTRAFSVDDQNLRSHQNDSLGPYLKTAHEWIKQFCCIFYLRGAIQVCLFGSVFKKGCSLLLDREASPRARVAIWIGFEDRLKMAPTRCFLGKAPNHDFWDIHQRTHDHNLEIVSNKPKDNQIWAYLSWIFDRE